MHRLALLVLLSLTWVAPGRATLAFEQPHSGSGTLHKSSWYPPDGLDGDMYCWDNFTLAASTAVTEVRWRGGYELHPSGSGQAAISEFEVSIHRSIAGDSQPDLGAGGRLAHYVVTGNAGETAAGTFGGVAMFDYAYVLPAAFQATGGTRYWVRIVASQGIVPPSYAPDWGLAAGTGGNNSHFRFTTGGTYQSITGDLAFSLFTSAAPTVTIAASESPAGAGTILGAGPYPVGTAVSLAASANAGWAFVNWTEGGVPVSANATYAFTASVDRTLVANFVPAYTISTDVWPSYGGTASGAGVYAESTTVTLVATPAHGFVFNSWSDGATTATHAFPATVDLILTAFFDSAPNAVTFDFNGGPYHVSLPLDFTVNGVTAHCTGGYSTQPANTLGFTPVGFEGWCLYPNSVFLSDLGIAFSELLTDFSVLYAVAELACDQSARMRVTAYRGGAFVGTSTMIAQQGTYPTATLFIGDSTGFDSVVVHWDAPGIGCGDYAPIFLADIVTVTRAHPFAGVDAAPAAGGVRLSAPAPNPFRGATAVRFALPVPGRVAIVVYDLAGRRVRTLMEGDLPAGERALRWDGTDDSGHPVRAGLYSLRLRTPYGSATTRAIMIP